MQPLLTPEQLAERLSLHPETVRRLTREKKIAHLTVGGVYRYDWAEVRQDLTRPLGVELAHAYLIPLLTQAAQYGMDEKLAAALSLVAASTSSRAPSFAAATREAALALAKKGAEQC